MKREVAWFVEQRLTYRKVKAEHQRPHNKVQPIPIPIRKWEEITMDFITKLPRMAWGVDSILGHCGQIDQECKFYFDC